MPLLWVMENAGGFACWDPSLTKAHKAPCFSLVTQYGRRESWHPQDSHTLEVSLTTSPELALAPSILDWEWMHLRSPSAHLWAGWIFSPQNQKQNKGGGYTTKCWRNPFHSSSKQNTLNSANILWPVILDQTFPKNWQEQHTMGHPGVIRRMRRKRRAYRTENLQAWKSVCELFCLSLSSDRLGGKGVTKTEIHVSTFKFPVFLFQVFWADPG